MNKPAIANKLKNCEFFIDPNRDWMPDVTTISGCNSGRYLTPAINIPILNHPIITRIMDWRRSFEGKQPLYYSEFGEIDNDRWYDMFVYIVKHDNKFIVKPVVYVNTYGEDMRSYDMMGLSNEQSNHMLDCITEQIPVIYNMTLDEMIKEAELEFFYEYEVK